MRQTRKFSFMLIYSFLKEQSVLFLNHTRAKRIATEGENCSRDTIFSVLPKK